MPQATSPSYIWNDFLPLKNIISDIPTAAYQKNVQPARRNNTTEYMYVIISGREWTDRNGVHIRQLCRTILERTSDMEALSVFAFTTSVLKDLINGVVRLCPRFLPPRKNIVRQTSCTRHACVIDILTGPLILCRFLVAFYQANPDRPLSIIPVANLIFRP